MLASCESVYDLPEIPMKKEVETMQKNGATGQLGSQGITIATMIATLATDEGMMKLDQEIEDTSNKLKRLVALRKALAKDTKADKPVVDSGTSVDMESKIEKVLADVTRHGPSTASDIAARSGLTRIGVGRAVGASSLLCKDSYGKVKLA